MPLVIRQIGLTDVTATESVLALYRETIVPPEQRPEADVRRLPGRSDYQVLAAQRGEETIGFAISFLPPGEDFWLFEYAATDPAERGRGVGAALFRRAQAAAGEAKTGLIEVDAEREGDDLTRRRLRFYARLGARRVRGLDYVLPLRTHGVPPPMVLLAFAPGSANSIPAAMLRGWLGRVYSDVYGQPPDDPRLARMINSLPDDVALDPI